MMDVDLTHMCGNCTNKIPDGKYWCDSCQADFDRMAWDMRVGKYKGMRIKGWTTIG